MAKKGQKFKTYSFELKKQAVEMRLKAKIRRKRHIHSRQVTGSENRIAENVLNRDFHAQAPN